MFRYFLTSWLGCISSTTTLNRKSISYPQPHRRRQHTQRDDGKMSQPHFHTLHIASASTFTCTARNALCLIYLQRTIDRVEAKTQKRANDEEKTGGGEQTFRRRMSCPTLTFAFLQEKKNSIFFHLTKAHPCVIEYAIDNFSLSLSVCLSVRLPCAIRLILEKLLTHPHAKTICVCVSVCVISIW